MLAAFEGTAWVTGTLLINVAFLSLSVGMFSSQRFARSTALLGVWTGVLGLFFLVPVIGPLASLGVTILGLPWLALLGRDLWRFVDAGGRLGGDPDRSEGPFIVGPEGPS